MRCDDEIRRQLVRWGLKERVDRGAVHRVSSPRPDGGRRLRTNGDTSYRDGSCAAEPHEETPAHGRALQKPVTLIKGDRRLHGGKRQGKGEAPAWRPLSAPCWRNALGADSEDDAVGPSPLRIRSPSLRPHHTHSA